MYKESELLPLSALQHYLFCPRQCALIHVEQNWTENIFTALGRLLHEKVDSGGVEARSDRLRAYSLPLRSLRLGLVGKADLVEFEILPDKTRKPYPVEYKKGRPKKNPCDMVQLCAQAICLEEMLECEIPEGALYYGANKRRTLVEFDHALRQKTQETAQKVHELLADKTMPKPIYGAQCKTCSLNEQCLPKLCGHKNKAQNYLAQMLKEMP